MTADQLRDVVARPVATGQWKDRDRGILVVFDAGMTWLGWPSG